MLSGVMVAMSFTAMVIPLAMYHVAQVAAAIGRQQSAVMLVAVVGFLKKKNTRYKEYRVNHSP